MVTVTLTFRPEVEAGLLAKAQERRMGLQAYLEAIVESDVLGQPGNTPLSETRPKAMEGQIGGLCRGRAS